MTVKIWTGSPRQQHRAGVLVRDGKDCALARLGGCSSEVDAHHIIPRQVIRRMLNGAPYWAKDFAVADSRNGCMLCTTHHSQPGDLTWADVPDQEGLLDFAEQYQLIGRLTHDFEELRTREYAVKASHFSDGRFHFDLQWGDG